MPTDQTWLDVKEYFDSAFNVWLTSGADTGASQGYYGANMGYDDDDSINRKRGDGKVYGFWEDQCDCFFDVCITDIDARPTHNKKPSEVLATQE